MVWPIMSGRWDSGCNVRDVTRQSQRGRRTNGRRKGQILSFQAFLSPCLWGGQKGWLRRLHFMRPFAPCFAEFPASPRVYLLSVTEAFARLSQSCPKDRVLGLVTEHFLCAVQ